MTSRFLPAAPHSASSERLLLVVLLAAAVVLPLSFLARKSITFDEVAHLPFGYAFLRTGIAQIDPTHPPLVRALCAAPLLLLGLPDSSAFAKLDDQGFPPAFQFEFGSSWLLDQDLERVVFWGRVPVVLLSACLAGLIALWAHELWGKQGAFVALFLYVFDPTVTAHAELATTDVGLAFFSTLSLFLLRRHLESPSPGRLVIAGVTLGLALGSKFTAVFLLPLFPTLLAWSRFRRSRANALADTLLETLILFVVAYATLWAIYRFPSDPLFYLRGLLTVEQDHSAHHLTAYMGEFVEKPQSYYLVAWAIKTPLPSLLLFGVSWILFARGQRSDAVEESLLLAPAATIFLAYSLLADPTGVRHLIPCFPLLFVFTGRIGKALPHSGKAARSAVVGMLVWQIVEFAAISPDHLSYFNEIAGGSTHGAEWLDDSNVDWGQGLFQLRDYVEAEQLERYELSYFGALDPRRYGIRGRLIDFSEALSPPVRETRIISAHFLARIRALLFRRYGNGPENWVAHARPKAIVGHAYWVYAPRAAPSSL